MAVRRPRRSYAELKSTFAAWTARLPGRGNVKPAAIQTADLVAPYLERLKELVHLERIRSSGRRFVIDPMYGAGARLLGPPVRRGGEFLTGKSMGNTTRFSRA